MKLQRQHFLLSYFKILSVDPAGVRQPDAQPTEPPVHGDIGSKLFAIPLKSKLDPNLISTCWSGEIQSPGNKIDSTQTVTQFLLVGIIVVPSVF